MLSGPEFAVVDRIVTRIAKTYYYHKLPHEDRAVWGVDDLKQEFFCHLLDKIDRYDDTRPLGRWARTVVYNRARSIVCDLWLEKWHKGRAAGLEVDRLFSTQWEQTEDGGRPVPVFVCDATPEDVLILLDEFIESEHPETLGAMEMADSKLTAETTVEEIRDLAKLVEFEPTNGEPKQDLEDLLYFALQDMDEDAFDGLAGDIQKRFKFLGDCYMNGDVSVVRRNGKDSDPPAAAAAPPEEKKAAPKSTAKKKAKSTAKKKPVAKKAAKKVTKKAAPKSTAKKKPAKKKAAKKKAAPKSTDDKAPSGTGPKSAAKVRHGKNPDGTKTRQHFDPDYLLEHPTDPNGKVHRIRVLFNRGKGITDAEAMLAATKDDLDPPSPETIRTHIRELCKFYRVTRKPGKRGPKGRGVQSAIEDAYAAGHKTVKAVTAYLAKKKIPSKETTIKGAVSLLRRNDSEVQAERRAAAKKKPVAKKKPAGKKKSTAKKKPAKKKAAKKKPVTKKKSTAKKAPKKKPTKPVTKKKSSKAPAKKKPAAKKKPVAKKKPTAKKRPAKSADDKKNDSAQPDEAEQAPAEPVTRRSSSRRSSRRT